MRARRCAGSHPGDARLNQVECRVGRGVRADADGIDRDNPNVLLDARHIGKPKQSVYVPETLDPGIRDVLTRKTEDLFRRYGRILNDPTSPFLSLKVSLDDEAGVPYFEKLMEKNKILGVIVVKE